jgi:hypothetical protein
VRGPPSPPLSHPHSRPDDLYPEAPLSPPIPSELRKLTYRLKVLRTIEAALANSISDVIASSPRPSSPASTDGFPSGSAGTGYGYTEDGGYYYDPDHPSEFVVRSRRSSRSAADPLPLSKIRKRIAQSQEAEQGQRHESVTDVQTRRVIHACAGDMEALWKNEEVQQILKKEELNLESGPGL